MQNLESEATRRRRLRAEVIMPQEWELAELEKEGTKAYRKGAFLHLLSGLGLLLSGLAASAHYWDAEDLPRLIWKVCAGLVLGGLALVFHGLTKLLG